VTEEEIRFVAEKAAGTSADATVESAAE